MLPCELLVVHDIQKHCFYTFNVYLSLNQVNCPTQQPSAPDWAPPVHLPINHSLPNTTFNTIWVVLKLNYIHKHARITKQTNVIISLVQYTNSHITIVKTNILAQKWLETTGWCSVKLVKCKFVTIALKILFSIRALPILPGQKGMPLLLPRTPSLGGPGGRCNDVTVSPVPLVTDTPSCE